MQIINYSNLMIEGLKPKVIIFPDKEFKIFLENVPKDSVYVLIVQTDIDPVQKIMATAMLINIVKQHNPDKIIIVHPWLSFSRQDRRFMAGEPLSIHIILDLYVSAGATDLVSFDIHSVMFREPGMHKYNSLTIHNVNFVQSFYEPNYVILSPTGTDEPFLKSLSNRNIPITYFKKEKYCLNCNKALQFCTCEGEVKKGVRIISELDFTGKNILALDDIIAGGGTMLATIHQLIDKGASKIIVGATHGFFNDMLKAQEIFENAKVKVSNTVSINPSLQEKLEIIDIIPTLLEYLHEKFSHKD
jgi:ribose-phosphate pyrophosphokinase